MSKVHRGTQEERDEAIAALLVGVIPRAGGAYRGPLRASTQLLNALRTHLKVNCVIFRDLEKKQPFQVVVI